MAHMNKLLVSIVIGLPSIAILGFVGVVCLRGSQSEPLADATADGKGTNCQLHFPQPTEHSSAYTVGVERTATILENYDEFKDRTVTFVVLTRFGVASLDIPEPGHRFSGLMVSAVRPGRDPKLPPVEVQWAFVQESFSGRHDVIGAEDFDCLADGKRIHFGSISPSPEDRGRTLWSATIPIETFLDMVNAESLRGRLGSREFVVLEQERDALRDYASRLAPH